MEANQIPTVLVAGGFDPSGGAGVLVDSAAVRRAGAHPVAVITVDTVQDGVKFLDGSPRPGERLKREVEVICGRFPISAVKVGALGSGDTALALAESVRGVARDQVGVVLDPVLASTSDGSLCDVSAFEVLRDEIIPVVDLITPNVLEAERLTGVRVDAPARMEEAANRLVCMGAGAALVKGGHLPGARMTDVLVLRDGGGPRTVRFERKRLDVGEVRGTGCALASLIAALLARGETLESACARGLEMLAAAMGASARVSDGPRVLVF